MKAPFDSFNNDETLKKALSFALQYSGISEKLPSELGMIGGTQACGNFRSGFAAHLYRKYCKPNSTVLDTSTGYGGRLVGFIASGVAGRYIGIDPNVPTYEGNVRLAADLGYSGRVELYNLPAEDVDAELLRDRCDFSFTSPPYFCKEIYSTDATQSCNRYKSGDGWREGFLVPMLALTFAALKQGATAIINIADVNIGKDKYPLADWTRESAQSVGFKYLRTDEFPMPGRPEMEGEGGVEETKVEPVLIFQKL